MNKLIADVSADIFARLTVFQSSEETRYYLCGVAIQPHADGAVMVATDGHVLGSWLDRSATVADMTPDGIIVGLPRDGVAACRKAVKAAEKVGYDAQARIHVYQDGETEVGIWTGDTMTPGTTVTRYADTVIDGIFPAWRRVVPDMSGEGDLAARREKFVGGECFNPKNIAKFDLGLKGAFVSLQINVQGSVMGIRVHGGHDQINDFYGACMPCRGYDDGRPDWFDTKPEQAEAETADA